MGRNRLIGFYLTIVGIAVAIQFVLFPLYGNSSDAGMNIWLTLDWFMALGLLLALYTTRQRQQMAGDTAGGLSTADLMFYGTAVLTLAFFPNWFGTAFTEHANDAAAWTIWHLIDSVMPVLFIAEGRRIIKA